ncbi:phenylacetate--CoA ligase family protein [Paradesulfitobacterium ferrireducens]|uniref:phenylacetate--CoA ligase family protein n=1 Tax=Paradesulfitobacterium ferrireducens TaxID=2816476 RepID=UPI001A8D984A|nr:AMP-binding protein [Paradesulfitobacterium ferrireducens]
MSTGIKLNSTADLETIQLHKLNQMLVHVSHFNGFYQEKLESVCLPLRSLDELQKLPFTTKKELVADQTDYPPLGRNHTYQESHYVRYHQTSGTTGRPLKVLDTQESWDWWRDCWVEVFKSAGVTADDRVFLAFSFGPFIGFWSAYEAAKKIGALVIPGGGQSSPDRLNSMIENKASVLLCTPSYALHLAELAAEQHLDIKNSRIRRLILAGEPGGSIPSVRERIESSWNAKVYDHVGMTEMGAYGYSCSAQNGIHVNEAEFIAEVIDPNTLEPVAEGEKGELVLTNLGRLGYPLIRYRTGDLVQKTSEPCDCGNSYRFFPGGIVGRADDMVVIRGINIYPQSLEAIIREFSEITEFRIVYFTEEEMNQVKVQIETNTQELKRQLEKTLRERLGLRIDVEIVEAGSLPRFEMKSRRVLDERLRKTS